MKDPISSSNISFEVLRNSPGFLYKVLDNISSSILLLNSKMELQAFNDPIKSIFSNEKDEDLLYKRCGEAIGCAYQVEEAKRCGETAHCKNCEIRISAMHSYLDDKVIFKEKFSRPFYDQNGNKVMKHLQFSTRLFIYKREKYIILIVDDITRLVNAEMELEKVLKNRKN